MRRRRPLPDWAAPENALGSGQDLSWGGITWPMGGTASATGMLVSPETAKQSTALSACVKLIAGAVALTEYKVCRTMPDGSRKELEGHNLWWLLNEQPHLTLAAVTFWEWMVASIYLRGDGFAFVLRDRDYQPVGLLPLPWESVQVTRNEQLSRLDYQVFYDGRSFSVLAEDMIHVPGFGFDGVRGESVITHAAKQALGITLAANQFTGDFFRKGAVPSLVVQFPAGSGPKTADKQQEFKNYLREKYGGNGNRGEPLVLTDGAEIGKVSVSMQDAQLLEMCKFQVTEIARACGVPPPMIGDTAVGNNLGTGVEQAALWFTKFTVGGLLKKLTQELNRKLIPRSRVVYVVADTTALTLGDSRTEAEVIARQLGGNGSQGYMSINEVRRRKFMPPIAGGDEIRFTLGDGVNNDTEEPANEQPKISQEQ